jgi:DNA-binding MarR family transcriptional regulator
LVENKEQIVLELLARHKALTLDNLAELVFDSDIKACYQTVRGLVQKRLILARKNPQDQRRRYVLLSKKGIQIAPEHLRGGLMSAYANRRRAEYETEINEIYVAALKAGIPASLILDRDDALKVLGILPAESPIAWLMGADSARYAVYLRKPEKRSFLLSGIKETHGKVAGHVVFYRDVDLSKDRRWFIDQVLPGDVHLFRLEDMPSFVRLLRDPSGWIDVFKESLEILSPGGRIYPAPSGCPLEWMWDKRGNPLLIGDLTTGNVALAARVKELRLDYMQRSRWGDGVLLLVYDGKDAAVWAKLLGYRPWVWFLSLDGPALYRCVGGNVVLFRRAQQPEEGSGLLAKA